MMDVRKTRFTTIVLAMLLALALVTVITGCGKKDDTTTTATGTSAKGQLSVAESALSTMAPDAKLLIVQTASGTPTTATPVWAYLFGSPTSNKTYVVYASDGQVMGASEYGVLEMAEDEWASVPGADEMKIDSDEAYTKALAASGAKGDPNAYMMGIMMFKPKEDTSTIEPLTWQVQFDPGDSGATTSTVEVDAKTGAASIATDQ